MTSGYIGVANIRFYRIILHTIDKLYTTTVSWKLSVYRMAALNKIRHKVIWEELVDIASPLGRRKDNHMAFPTLMWAWSD